MLMIIYVWRIAMNELELAQMKLAWCLDIIGRINNILESPGWTDEQKLVNISGLVKQALSDQTQ